jgi:hypothetical protein
VTTDHTPALARIAAIAGTVVCLLGASSAAQASTHHKGITQAKAAKQYLADIKPVNAVGDLVNPAVKAATTAAGQAKAVAPWLAIVVKFDSLVLRQQWPTGVKGDIRALVVDDAAVIGDYQALSSASPLNISSLDASLSRDNQADTTASNIVRADLGLPPP